MQLTKSFNDGTERPARSSYFRLPMGAVRLLCLAVRQDFFMLGEAGGRDTVTPEIRAVNCREARIPDNEGNRPTGGKILPCFALSNLPAADKETFPDTEAAYEHFEEKLKPLRTFGIYPECSECVYFETELCCGGCIAARLRRLQPIEAR